MNDAETGEHLYVDTADKRFRRRFAEVVQRRDEALGAAFRRVGVDALELSTEEDLVRSIVRFAAVRRLRRSKQRAVKVAS
jgi:DNA transposition AAA+ family ATPase